MLAMLTLIWGGWMYFKSSDDEAKLRGIRNELKVAKQELGDARAAYEEESKKCETLAGEIDTLKENAQELRKGITAKREEKKKLAAQERRDRLEAERKARKEEIEAREEKARAEREKARKMEADSRMALLEREKQFEKEKEEEEKAEQVKRDVEYKIREIENSTRSLSRYSTCPSFRPKSDKNDFGQFDRLKQNWTSHVQSCIEAVNDGDSKRFESFGKKLLSLAKAVSRLSEDGGCITQAGRFLSDGRDILKAKKELKELEKSKKSESQTK